MSIKRNQLNCRSILAKACKLFELAEGIPTIRPNFQADAAKLADTRKQLPENNPSNPEINRINNEIFKLVSEHKKSKIE